MMRALTFILGVLFLVLSIVSNSIGTDMLTAAFTIISHVYFAAYAIMCHSKVNIKIIRNKALSIDEQMDERGV